jgi:hypothetical protein
MSLVKINLGKPATTRITKEAKLEAEMEAIMEAIMTATTEARLPRRNTVALTTREAHGEDDSVRYPSMFFGSLL